MKIALCEDEIKYIEDASKKLKDYTTPDGEKIILDVYENASKLLDVIGKEQYDAIIMDIIMQGLNGMEAARDIRRINKDIPIVFLTSSPEFAVESYRVRAFDYLMKPVKTEELFSTLNDIYATRQVKAHDNLTITHSKGTHVVPINKLVYLEVRNRILYFHMLNGMCIEVTGKISDYEEPLLAHESYLKVHRSFIINMEHMKAYERKDFVAVTGETIPISRTIIKEVQSSYMDYLHNAVRAK